MSEDTTPLIVEENSDRRNGLAKSAIPEKSSASRTATWPLMAFILAFSYPPSDPHLTTTEFVGISLGAAIFWALVAWIAALTIGRRRGPTKSALPNSQGPRIALAFNLSILAIVGLKMLHIGGALPVALGIIPIGIISRGASRVK